jgi:hypothetical protein
MQTTKATAFPSPSGDYFFNIPLKLVKDILNRCEQFPPPLGDYFFNKATKNTGNTFKLDEKLPSPSGGLFFNGVQARHLLNGN